MQLPPINVVLQWPTPNYANPETHGPALLVVNIIFIILVLVAVVGRFYARIIYKKWFGIDDVACVFALVSGSSSLDGAMLRQTDLHIGNRRGRGVGERALWLEQASL